MNSFSTYSFDFVFPGQTQIRFHYSGSLWRVASKTDDGMFSSFSSVIKDLIQIQDK